MGETEEAIWRENVLRRSGLHGFSVRHFVALLLQLSSEVKEIQMYTPGLITDRNIRTQTIRFFRPRTDSSVHRNPFFETSNRFGPTNEGTMLSSPETRAVPP